jgi:molybdate transport system ATP-binding protein
MTMLRVDITHQFAAAPGRNFRLATQAAIDTAAWPVTVLFGPSGAGKTSLLRAVAGLDKPETGVIDFGGEVWSDAARAVFVPPQQRRIGFVPQDQGLFPHLSVRDNVAYGAPRGDSAAIDACLARFGLAEIANQRASLLSGGQGQRVALARAIVTKPRLLLLDEPLSSLDAAARVHVRTELRRLIVESGVPALLVTHDQGEAIALGDGVVVMMDGAVRQIGPLAECFSRPADAGVAHAIGVETVLPGTVESTNAGLSVVALAGVRLFAVNELGVQGSVLVCIRASDVTLSTGDRSGASGSARNHLAGRIASVESAGPVMTITLDAGLPLRAIITRAAWEDLALSVGATVTASIKATSVHLVAR